MNNKYWIWLSRVENVKSINKKMLIEKYKNPEILFNLNINELKQIKYLSNDEINEILKIKYRNNLDKYEKYMIDSNIEVINFWSEKYPKKLKQIYDSPVVLYAKGNINLLKNRAISIVGSRNCTDYGSFVAKDLAYNLAKENICIISGMAKGIDSWAHIGALENNGKTIAVIGNGLNTVYPKENTELLKTILQQGGLVLSEFIVGTKPSKMNFPKRNRIISGLSDAVVVVEAEKRSGALITSDFAIEQGKEVFAVPGNITSNNSVGTNNLIAEGANILLNYKDILNIY